MPETSWPWWSSRDKEEGDARLSHSCSLSDHDDHSGSRSCPHKVLYGCSNSYESRFSPPLPGCYSYYRPSTLYINRHPILPSGRYGQVRQARLLRRRQRTHTWCLQLMVGMSVTPNFLLLASHSRKPLVDRDDCQAQTAGFPGNKHQKFPTYDQARKYLAEHGVFIGSSNVSSSSSSTPSSSHSLQHGPAARGRVHGSKPYARVKPPSTPTTSVQEPSRSNSRWAALASEVIQDESGWDVVYSDGACKGNGKVGSVAGVGVWWGDNDARYAFLVSIAFIISSDRRMHG